MIQLMVWIFGNCGFKFQNATSADQSQAIWHMARPSNSAVGMGQLFYGIIDRQKSKQQW